MLNVLYLVHDLQDPATRRRTMMLEAGGASVTVAGFHRAKLASDDKRISFGATQDGNFNQRISAVFGAATNLRKLLSGVSKPDCIIARNLETLFLARRATASFGDDNIPIVYECLDIHRLLLRKDAVGIGLRWLERRLSNEVSLLLTSSPAFLAQYFDAYGQCAAPSLIVENRLLDLDAEYVGAAPDRSADVSPPWVIGWFGALRCSRSLAILSDLSRKMDGRVKVQLRGRPAMREIPGFRSAVVSEPYLSFEGAYRNPEDMATIYGHVHFTWAIDFFEEGQNSEWLLPNRLYEGCRFGAVPIALRRTEVGKFLARKGFGILLDEASPETLKEVLGTFSEADYAEHQARIAAVDPSTWVCTARDCRELVAQLPRSKHPVVSLEPSILDRRAA
ncbi:MULTISPECIES: glycosyl transferase family 1 [Mesorhizobium]|uniref:Glycosyl transferase family 1 n=1 Tax=Mesorhizobium denitrificans TaxID=2294114 RepID=A0A371X952_9HYPH|nr:MULTISPECIES: glycosyl transferase family 1 [Mesorhizobium]RFC65759.1 glycosyl transferase family 1 [Mesorhizobium denitrificans]